MGHGKAIIELQLNGDHGREEILLQACLRNTLFDRWFDELKGQYLCDALQATGRLDHYVHILLSRIDRVRSYLDKQQWADLFGKLTIAGCEAAKRHLIENWRHELDQDQSYLARAYILVGEAPAYREVLAYLEHLWHNRRKPVEYGGYMHMDADDAIGKRGQAIRDRIAKRNPKFAYIADFPKPFIARDPIYEKEQLSPTERIKAGKLVDARLLTVAEALEIAELLEQGLEGKLAERGLRAFRQCAFPANLSVLRRYLNSDEQQVQRLALTALGANRDESLRELALQYCDSDYLRDGAIGLLRLNFKPGDEVWIEQQLRRPNDSWRHHWSIVDTREVIDANPKAKWEPILRYLLDITACQLCREGIAGVMYKRKLLSHDDVAALTYDADSYTRERARKWQHRNSRTA